MEIEFLVQNSGQDPSRDKILCFHVRYSNGNILSFWYWNHLKAQIHLCVQDYNFDEGVEVR
jgi:hypothetical protein